MSEHWTEKIQAQSGEGCNVAGRIKVNKVVGNLHFSPGKSFQSGMSMNDLVPYLQDGEVHNWGHTVKTLSFESAEEEWKVPKKEEMKRKLGMVVHPLDAHFAHVSHRDCTVHGVSALKVHPYLCPRLGTQPTCSSISSRSSPHGIISLTGNTYVPTSVPFGLR